MAAAAIARVNTRIGDGYLCRLRWYIELAAARAA
jgi:hypothetical protein